MINLFIGLGLGFLGYRALVLLVRHRRKNAPITEIHVEKIEDDECYLKLRKYCEKHPSVMLMVKVSKWDNETRDLIINRYSILRDLGNPIGLHTHLALDAELPRLTYEKQFKLIQLGKSMLEKELNVDIGDFVSGWWALNNDTVKALKILGFQRVHINRIQGREAKMITKEGLSPIKVTRYLHDWNL